MKTKSLCVLVFRPSRRRTSSYACSLLKTMDKNGTPATKCRASTKTVIKAQMPARIIKRCRPSQCTAELYQKMSKHECRMSNVEGMATDEPGDPPQPCACRHDFLSFVI